MATDLRKPPVDIARPAVGRNRASDEAERYIRSLIYSGTLGPGDRLPTERDMAAQLGISRVTLRAAIRALGSARFLTVTVGSKGGARVNTPEVIAECWHDWMRRHRHEANDMFEFRQLLESSIVALAAQRRTEADVAELEKIGFAPPDGWTSVTRWHNRFHDGLAAAAHNPYLQSAYASIRDKIFAPPLVVDERRIAEMRQVHEFILEAVRDGDSERAAAAIKLHGHVAIKLHGDTSQLSE